MKRLLSTVLFLFCAMLVAAAPAPQFTVSNAEPFVTESWTAKLVFFLEPLQGRFAETCPLKAPTSSPFPSMFDESRTGLSLDGFPVEGTRFAHAVDRVKIDGVNYWRITLVSDPIPATTPGPLKLGPVVVRAALFDGQLRRGFFGAEPHIVRRDIRMGTVTLTVREPPREGRPAVYSGAIGAHVTATAALDANVCTAGDPLMLTVRVDGALDPSRIRPPTLGAELAKEGVFRVDEKSVKSSLDGNVRVFTWRVRAVKAGTVEFPSLALASFDTAAKTYRLIKTASIPVQVKAGQQVALGEALEAEGEEAFPLPDGLDLDFTDAGSADFTFKRAVSLACRATTEREFATAAAAYQDYLAQQPKDPLSFGVALTAFDSAAARLSARHCANLGALRLMGGDARGAWAAFARAGDFSGEDASILRGLKAAQARLKNDPRAELPLTRLFFPFFFKMTLWQRVAAGVLGGLLLALAWIFAGRMGRGGVLGLLLFAALLPMEASAQFSFRSSFNRGGNGHVAVSVALQPAETFVGEPSAFIFSFEVENGVDVDQLGFGCLPEPAADRLAYGEPVRLSDAASAKKGYVVKRVKLPVRFFAPFAAQVAPRVEGMLVTRRGNGTSFSFTSSTSFAAMAKPCAIDVKPLPTEGRPADFSGAVGKNFRLQTRLMPPRVRPGDLVTAEYTLFYDGYYPTNLPPRIEGLGTAFKTYELKTVDCVEGRIRWRQMIVPESVAATNAIETSLAYYDVATKRYTTAAARPQKLVFVSKEAASTENTSVLIDSATQTTVPAATSTAIVLRFAPAETSPVVATLSPATELKTLATRGAWRRVAAPQAIGWQFVGPAR